MFEEVYRLQRELNNRVLGFDIMQITSEEEKLKWFRNYLTAYDQELKELVGSMDLTLLWGDSFLRNARKQEGKLVGDTAVNVMVDIQNVRIEIVDMLHFLVSMFQVIGEKNLTPPGSEGRSNDVERYFSTLRESFEARYGRTLMAATDSERIVRIVFIACLDFISLGALLDCTAWKWWAKQELNWSEAKRILYDEIFPHWCLLVMAAGMDAVGVQDLYCKKNRLNFERQEKGYKTGIYEKTGRNGVEDNKKLFR